MRIAGHALWGVLALALGACGGRMQVRAEVPVPPELPVRVFPEIVVVVDGVDEEIAISDALAVHLAATSGASRIERLDEHRLALRRAQGAIGPASVVLRVDAQVIESLRPTWVTRPQTVCGPWGCTTEQRPTIVDMPVVDATAVLRVSEARSDQVLQELPLREHEESSDAIGMRVRVLGRLRERAIASVDPGRVVLAIELEPVDDAEVRAALEAIRAGHPAEARRALERVVERSSFEARSEDDRAKILFDLGQARRLEGRAEASLGELEREQRLAEAEAAIRDAIRIRPQAPYARALAQIEEEREARARMRAVEEAASHNFALGQAPAAAGTAGGEVGGQVGADVGAEVVPEPPPGYGDALPAPPPP